jgi:methyl-accepting chemotaxis protein
MKNLKLNKKLAILSGTLTLLLIVVAAAAMFGLYRLGQNIDELTNVTFERLQQIAGVRSAMLDGTRYQKNAVITEDDGDSKKFSENAKQSLQEAIAKVASLSSVETDPDRKSLLESLKPALELLKEENERCMDMAEMNTGVKAKNRLFGPLAQQVSEFIKTAKSMRKTLPLTAGEINTTNKIDPVYEAIESAYIVRSLLFEHIETDKRKSSTESLDQSIEDNLKLIEDSVAAIASATGADNVSSAAMNRSVAALRRETALVIADSAIDSNRQSASISLNEYLKANNNAIAIIDQLMTEYDQAADESARRSNSMVTFTTIVVFGTLIGSLIVSFFLSRAIGSSLVRRVSEVRNLANQMATGDLTGRLQVTELDEVGDMARSADAMAGSFSQVVCEMQKASNSLAGSATDLEGVSQQFLGQSELVSQMVNNVGVSAEELSANIATISAATEQMSVNMASISSATEEVSVNVSAISTAAEQTSANVNVVALSLQEITNAFGVIQGVVQQGGRIAAEAMSKADSATNTMQRLDQASIEISEFTETIKMISMQTNLLALNATIEATSAGEAGKGFAVVAHEIKQLANQSAKAAEDIAKKIDGVQLGTRQAVAVIREINNVVKEMNASSQRISTSVEQQTKFASTISSNVKEANNGVTHIARSIAEVASMSTDMSRNVAEATHGVTDISRNVSEAATVANGITSTISGIGESAAEASTSAKRVYSASDELGIMSQALQNISKGFKIRA